MSVPLSLMFALETLLEPSASPFSTRTENGATASAGIVKGATTFTGAPCVRVKRRGPKTMKVSAAGALAGGGAVVPARRAALASALAPGGITASQDNTKIINQPVLR
jgi:hypothetical protein